MTEIETLELFYWDSNSKVSQWQVSDSDGLIQYSDGLCEDVLYIYCQVIDMMVAIIVSQKNWKMMIQFLPWYFAFVSLIHVRSPPVATGSTLVPLGLFFPFSFKYGRGLNLFICWNCWMIGRDFNVNDLKKVFPQPLCLRPLIVHCESEPLRCSRHDWRVVQNHIRSS